MKKENEIRAEFENWFGQPRRKLSRAKADREYLKKGDYICAESRCQWQAWQANQNSNDKVIAAKDAEIIRLHKIIKDTSDELQSYYNCDAVKAILKNALEKNNDK